MTASASPPEPRPRLRRRSTPPVASQDQLRHASLLWRSTVGRRGRPHPQRSRPAIRHRRERVPKRMAFYDLKGRMGRNYGNNIVDIPRDGERFQIAMAQIVDRRLITTNSPARRKTLHQRRVPETSGARKTKLAASSMVTRRWAYFVVWVPPK